MEGATLRLMQQGRLAPLHADGTGMQAKRGKKPLANRVAHYHSKGHRGQGRGDQHHHNHRILHFAFDPEPTTTQVPTPSLNAPSLNSRALSVIVPEALER